MAEFQRARNDDQIEERRSDILATAKNLCAESGVMGWSLNELGRQASINKSNLYRYFGSREEVLMSLLLDEMSDFVEAFDRRIQGEKMTIEGLADLLTQHYVQRPFFCELLGITASVLEHNVAVEPIAEIKRSMVALTVQHTGSLGSALEWLGDEQAGQACGMIGIFVSGLWPVANPAESVRELAKLEEFDCLKFDFAQQLNGYIQTLFAGYQARCS